MADKRRRDRKKYRPVKLHAYVCKRPKQSRISSKNTLYVIYAGTPCRIRKIGEKVWKEHRTRVKLLITGYLWRNQSHYGFAAGDWELKVEIGLWDEEPT